MSKLSSRNFRPSLESLSDRLAPSVSIVNGDIWIEGSALRDVVTVSRIDGPYNSPTLKAIDIYRVVENGVTTDIPVSSITGGNVVFNGNQGNDSFTNLTWLGALASGGDGSDELIGGPGPDYMHGGYGRDAIDGRGGSDQLFANTDIDMSSDIGENTLLGGDGLDYLHGSGGVDYLDGGPGEDYLFGYSGADVLHASTWTVDTNYNFLSGGDGIDHLRGNAGMDDLFGGNGHDFLEGASGNDNLFGGQGSDVLWGGDGDDGLFGGRESPAGPFDNLQGGQGADRFLVVIESNGGSNDSVADQETADAHIGFRDTQAVTNTTVPGQSGLFSFAAGVWTDEAIEAVGVSLKNLHNHTGNTRLLKTASRGQIDFLARGVQTDSNAIRVDGWNTNGSIVLVNAVNRSAISLQRMVYHEIAHNWDEDSENRRAGVFRAQSGWTESVLFPIGYLPSTATGDRWWYRTSALGTFANAAGRANPSEDMATTWEAYFLYAYHGGSATLAANGLIRHAGKWASLDLLFADLRAMP